MRPFHSQAEGLHPLSPLLGSSPSVCPNTAECGREDDSTPFFPDKKTEVQSPGVGTEVKREWKRPPKGGCPKSRTILRGSGGLPHYSVSRPQPVAFAIETVLPPSSAPLFCQCTLGNAVYLSLSARDMSPLRVLKGLQVPEGCTKTPAGSRGFGLARETEEPAGGAEGMGDVPPQWATPGRGSGLYWLRRHGGGGVSGMRRGAVRRSRC